MTKGSYYRPDDEPSFAEQEGRRVVVGWRVKRNPGYGGYYEEILWRYSEIKNSRGEPLTDVQVK